MNKLTVSVLLALLFCGVCSVISGAQEVDALTDKIIRIHVIANSDSQADQQLKLKVRDGILDVAAELTSGCKNKEEAEARIRAGLDVLTEAAKSVIAENGGGYGVNVTLGREEFDRREYDGFTLPAGDYDALCIRLGEAKGKNWWCVCYPSLCFGTSVNIDDCGVFTDGELTVIKEPQKVRYKLWCFELVRKIAKVFK